MGNAHATVVNQTAKPVCILTFNMTDLLCKFYKTLYIVEPGETMIVEANPDAVGLRLGVVYDALDNKDVLLYRFSCSTDSILTLTSVDAKQIQHYGDKTTQNSNGKLGLSATSFQLVLNTLNADRAVPPPPSSPSNPRTEFIKQRKNSVISEGSLDYYKQDVNSPSSTSVEFTDPSDVYIPSEVEPGKVISIQVTAILSASVTVFDICQIILTNNAMRADQTFPSSLFEDFLILNATLTSIASFYKTCVVHTGVQVTEVSLVYFDELIADARKFSEDSTRDLNTLKKRYRFLFSAHTIKNINKKLIDDLLLPLTVRAFTNVSIHLNETPEQTRSVIGKIQASMDQVIQDMCSESVLRLKKTESSSPPQLFRKRSATRDAPEPPTDLVLQSLQLAVGNACVGMVDGVPCTKCQNFGFDILAKFTPLSAQSTKCSYCSCDVSCHSGPKVDKAFIEAREAAEAEVLAAQPRSSLGVQRRESLLHASPEKVNPIVDLQQCVGRACSNIVDGSRCNKCEEFGFEIQPRYTPLSAQSTKCGLCSCDVSCHDGPFVIRK